MILRERIREREVSSVWVFFSFSNKSIHSSFLNCENLVRFPQKKTLGILAVTIPDDLFGELVKNLIKRIQNVNEKSEVLRTYLQAVVSISRSVGFRLGRFLNEIVPAVVKYCQDSKFDKDDDLREHSFQCFESLILRCPKEINPFLEKIIELALKFIKYDPNYSEQDDNEEMDVDEKGEEEEEEEEEEEVEEENYEDDDDMSWKVRRACSRVLSALITTRTDLLSSTIYHKVIIYRKKTHTSSSS